MYRTRKTTLGTATNDFITLVFADNEQKKTIRLTWKEAENTARLIRKTIRERKEKEALRKRKEGM